MEGRLAWTYLHCTFKGTGQNKFVGRGSVLPGVGWVIEDTTYLMNIIDKILLALKFEFRRMHRNICLRIN